MNIPHQKPETARAIIAIEFLEKLYRPRTIHKNEWNEVIPIIDDTESVIRIAISICSMAIFLEEFRRYRNNRCFFTAAKIMHTIQNISGGSFKGAKR